MRTIDRISRIDRAALSGIHYLRSLMEQGSQCGLLSDSDVERIQAGCMSLLARQVDGYSGGDSSVRVEKAQSLMESILFTISVALKAHHSPDDALAALRTQPPSELYQIGLKRIDALLESARAVHGAITRNLFESPNVFYRSTVVDAIKGFFKLYNPAYGAQEIHITADYPTSAGTPDLAGIEFIHRYLEDVHSENLFCRCFDADVVHHLLCGVDKGYADLPINLHEPVLTTALCCCLVGKNPRTLELSGVDVDRLVQIFTGISEIQAQALLTEALDRLAGALSLPASLSPYLQASLSGVALSIRKAIDAGIPGRVFVVPAYPERDPVMSFSFGEKMDDERYRKIVDELLSCRRGEDKISIIRENVHSLADLSDILVDGELSRSELTLVLQTTSLVEIVALAKRFQYAADPLNDAPDRERELYASLQEHLGSLPAEQRNWAAKALSVIDIEP